MANFGSLWIGGEISTLHKICLKSFLQKNHTVTLFVYDLNIEVPDGVVKIDAREILSEKNVFLFYESYAGFSDIFRIHMIKKTGLIWVDIDTFCFSEDWNFSNDFIFGRGHEKDNRSMIPGVLLLEKNHAVIDAIIEDIDKKTHNYHGRTHTYFMDSFSDKITKFNLEQYCQPSEVFHPIYWNEIQKIFLPQYFQEIKKRTKNSKCMSLYNNALKGKNIDQNIFPEGSFVKYICEQID